MEIGEREMTKKLTLLLIILLLALVACQPKPTQPENPSLIEISSDELREVELERSLTPAILYFTDDLGRKVPLTGPAQRIVTLGPSIVESLFAIGAGPQVVGREEFSTYPEGALDVTSVGSLWGVLPTEAILALEPDLVIAPEIISPEQIQAMEDLGLNVYFQANPVDFEGLWDN
jgi:iron complex transport system substrate-binding protein